MQANTRRFCDDQRRAEIGRENRKLVDKLASISKGTAGSDPRGPPALSSLAAMRGSRTGPSVSMSSSDSFLGDRTRLSLNETHRRKTERCIGQDNASLLQRLLAVNPTLDRHSDARDFQRHQRTVQLLQRLPDGAHKRPQKSSSLPVLGRSGPLSRGNLSAPAQGLEALLLPEDLHRFDSRSSLVASSQRPSVNSHQLGSDPGSASDISMDEDIRSASEEEVSGGSAAAP